MSMLCDNLTQKNGHLYFAGYDTCALAQQFGTPAYFMDEERIRSNCRMYTKAFRDYFPQGSTPLYASKASSFRRIYQIIAEEGMGCDVVSGGEICTARAAGFDLSKAYFHSNNKTDEDIAYAMDVGIGYFVVDNSEEMLAISTEAMSRGITQKVLLRITPGIDPHTYEEVSTGMVDSKFGSAIETGQADEMVELTLQCGGIHLAGFHCHVGSQVFEEDVFERAVVVMLEFISHIKQKYGYVAEQLDLGGGFGVRYVASDPEYSIPEKLKELSLVFHSTCERLKLQKPVFHMEPGRSIVADAGLTVYTVGMVKRIPGYKNYVSVNGGMTDNPRYALYRSSYTCLTANKMDDETVFPCSLVGRCCESGDIIQENVLFPLSIQRGDLVAVCTTGAYNYSMASNYNRIPRPPVVMLTKDDCYVAVRRESFEDLIANDL